MKETLRKQTSSVKYVYRSEILPDCSQPCICTDLQVVLMKRSLPNSPFEYLSLAKQPIGLSS